MPRTNLWSHSVPRAEIDQRSREARLRFELIVRLFMLRATATHTRLRRLLYLITAGKYGTAQQPFALRHADDFRALTGKP